MKIIDKFLIGCFVFLLLMVPGLVSAAPVQQNDLLTVRVGYNEDPGYMEKDPYGIYYGYDVDFLVNIAQYAGFKIEYVDYDTIGESYDGLNTGKIDMVLGYVKTPERERQFLFSKREIGSINTTLLVSADDDRCDYGDIDKIAHMKFAVEKDNYSNFAGH